MKQSSFLVSLFAFCIWSESVFADPPVNDMFGTPVALTELPASISGSNVNATMQDGEPQPGGYSSAGASVWFQFTAPTTGLVQIDTYGSDFDTVLAVWTGSALEDLALQEVNDDSGSVQSMLSISVEAGVIYWIAIYGYSSESQGNIALHVAAFAPGEISGVVKGPDGTTPLEGILVQSYNPSTGAWGWDWTDSAGQYEIGGLAAGSYRIRFSDGTGTHAPEIFNNIPGDNIWNYGALIAVAEGATTTGIDASLALAGRISGTVTGPDGTMRLEGIYVESYNPAMGRWGPSDYTDANGQYEIGGLATGSYRIRFSDPSSTYMSEVYYDIPGDDFWNYGALIAVAEGATTTGIDASLALAGRISGRVTDTSSPLESISVTAYAWNGRWWDWVKSASTDENGNYEIGSLPGGNYRVRFSANDGIHVGEVYNDKPDLDSGDDVAVTAGVTTPDIDAVLDLYASLAGTITAAVGGAPLAGVYVCLIGTADGPWDWARTSADGGYVFSQIRPGDYVVQAEPTRDGAYLGQWHAGILYVPGQDDIPAEAIPHALASGEQATGVDFALVAAGRISGTVSADGGLPLAGALVKAKNGPYGLTHQITTDDAGAYELTGLLPGDHTLKAGAEDYRDEWWTDATHEDQATPIAVASGSDLTHDFVLLPGQNPALVEIVSDPSGAAIYLDYQATAYVTPALVDVGEVASHVPRMGGWAVASHVVSLKKAGHPRPAPQVLPAVEAETVSITIDMTSAAEGGLTVVTDPADAEVYIDYADMADGLTPLTVESLAPGSHTVLLKKPGYLQARPIIAQVEAGTTNEIVVPLAPIFSPDRIMAEVQSSPTGATIFVDYFPTADITDAVIDWMDPASHSGSGWHSASHAVMLRKLQKLPGAPRYVPDVTNAVQTNLVHLIVDVTATADEDGDGLPDSWEPDEDDYPGWDEQGPDDDYDGDGVTNFGELIAGTHPGNPDSTFKIDDGDLSTPGNNDSFTLTFSSVPGRMYFIRGKTSMSRNAEWVNLTGIILATGFETTCTVQFPESENMRFFQLVVWNP